MTIDDYRMGRSNNGKKKTRLKKGVVTFINKVLVSIIVILCGMILTKRNPSYISKISKYVYQDSISFTKLKKLYNKYFGKYIGETLETQEVFSEKITYSKKDSYKDGVKLEVNNNYLVPTLEAGIVIFIGSKDGYGNTAIVEQINGINVWYCNIEVKDIKMYDYVKKGDLVGEVKGNTMYLLFEKNGKFLDYKKYI